MITLRSEQSGVMTSSIITLSSEQSDATKSSITSEQSDVMTSYITSEQSDAITSYITIEQSGVMTSYTITSEQSDVMTSCQFLRATKWTWWHHILRANNRTWWRHHVDGGSTYRRRHSSPRCIHAGKHTRSPRDQGWHSGDTRRHWHTARGCTRLKPVFGYRL